jgi:excisionase family DNA binding protein
MLSSGANEALTVTLAALRLGVSPFTVRSWLRQRRIPFFRLGRRIVIHAADV